MSDISRLKPTPRDWAVSGITLLVFIILTAVFGPNLTEASSQPTNSAQPTPTATPTPTPTLPEVKEVPYTHTFSKDDFSVTLKVTEKKCYGSAGCNVTVEPKISIRPSLVQSGTVDLTFSVSGDESGKIIQTETLYLEDGTYSTSKIMVSTPSSSTKVAAKVVSLEYDPDA